ncbi:MAG: hypothetical protein DYH15_13000, partial [Nitrosomonas sp. PRO4]|nr:hypothetical protein [Nitrosomonas sp. PRO4]
EQAANDANAALSGAKTVKPGSKPALPDELSKARESSAKAAASSAKQAADAKAREAKQALESSQKIIESLKRETQEVGLNNVQKKMLVAATEAAKAPTKELAAEIMNSAAAWAQATQKQEESLAQQKLLKEAADERARAEKQAAQQVQQQWRNTWSQVEQNAKMAFIQFAAHGKSAAQAVGEAIKFSIIDVLYQMTIRKWIINIGTSLESTFASSMVGSSGGSTLNTLFNGAGLLNAGKTIFDGFFGAMKSGTSSLVGGIGSLGSSLPGTAGAFFSGMGGTGAAAAQGAQGMWRASGLTGANAMGAAAGSAFASMAGPLLIGYFATKGLKSLAGDKRLGGGFGDAMNFVGDIPILGDLIPIIPIINGLFGRGPLKQKETSLTGLIGTQGFESGTFQTRFKAQGGLFRSDKTDFARVDAVTGEVSSDNRKLLDFANQMSGTAKQIIGLINDTTQQTSGSLRKIAKDLGLSTASLDTFQHTINLVSEKGKALTEEQIGKEISNITESLAKSLIPEIDSLAKKGETALQAVGRLGVEFNALVNSAAILLGKTVADSRAFVSGFGFQDRTAFVDQAGGADELLRKTAFFAENFLTNAERLAPKQALLNEELQKLGLSADLTRDEFRKLMQTSGPDMVQSLLNLQFSFVEVRTAQEQLAEATRQKAEADRESAKIAQEAARAQLLSNASGAFSALQKSIDRERERLTNDYNAQLDKVNTRIQDVTQSIGKLKSLSDALKNTINQIQPLNRDQAKQQIKDAINIARRGGDLPDAESLRNALGVLGNNQTIDNASTPFEKAREQAKTAILLGQLGNVTDSRLTLEERSLAALESQKKRLETGFDDQMKRLDTMLEQGQTQIDLLNGINTSIMSMADALSKFNFRLLQAGGQPIALPSGEIPVMRGNPKISDQQIRDFANAPGRTAMEIYNAARENGVSFTQYANATGANLKTLRLWARRHGLPTFADGGLHSGGLRIVGERGPELEFTGPSRITSNNDLNKLLNNDAVVNELRVLVAEIKEVKKSSERTAARLDAVTRGGTALRTKAA